MTDHPGAGHPDLVALAEVEEGVAGPEVERATRAHLDGCAQCRDRLAHLRTTRALLSTLPPESMPAEVQTRVSAALERAASEPSTTVVPLGRRTRFWNSPAVAGAAAAAAVVVLVGALVVGHVVHHGKPTTSASAPLADNNRKSAAGAAAATKEWSTGTNYTAASIPALVPRLVTGTPPSTTSAAGQATNATTAPVPAGGAVAPSDTISQQAMRSDPSAVLACGTILAGGVRTVPVAVDFARYEGKPAVVFALPAIGHPELLDVWVVRSTCSVSSLDVYFRRIPRPTG